jgi:DNA-binding transcriptional LysR family regulator
MRALPVDVVRAFLAIVDCRGFTRAAEQLGRTQPTISLQIRRLEELIGAPVFENTARLTLTPRGRTLLEYGRMFVAAHDDLGSELARHDGASPSVRLGMANEFASLFAPALVDLAQRSGESFAFDVTCDQSETLIDRVRARELDIALAMTEGEGAGESVAHWPAPLTWVAAPGFDLSADAPLRLVTSPEGTLFYNIAAAALTLAGRRFEIVCKSANLEVLRSAVEAGYGVSVGLKSLAPKQAEAVAALTPLPDVTLGLYARDAAERSSLLAHMIDAVSASPALAA